MPTKENFKHIQKASPVAKLTLVVHFDSVPDDSDLERIVDEARAYGSIEVADFEVERPFKRSIK